MMSRRTQLLEGIIRFNWALNEWANGKQSMEMEYEWNCRDLSENNLWALSTEQLAGPEQLASLQLDHNQLHCLDSLALSRWSQLETLSLNGNCGGLLLGIHL